MFDDENARPPDYTIALPAGIKLINSNDRQHHMARNRLTQAIKDAARVMSRKEKIPRLERVYIRGLYCPPTRRVRDPANWYPSFKAAIDGLTDQKIKGVVMPGTGILPDDDDEHVVGPDMRLGEPVKLGQIVLQIWDLTVSGEGPGRMSGDAADFGTAFAIK